MVYIPWRPHSSLLTISLICSKDEAAKVQATRPRMRISAFDIELNKLYGDK